MTDPSSSSDATMAALRVEFADLLDPATALDVRIRALYRLKESQKNVAGAQLLLEAVDTTDSVLLQHELVYNVGQFGFKESVDGLKRLVAQDAYDVVTRHEAIEALGAIAEDAALPFLRAYAAKNGPAATCAPIRESAVLAVCRMEMLRKDIASGAATGATVSCPFVSVDPSPAFAERKTLAELEAILLNEDPAVNCRPVEATDGPNDAGDATAGVEADVETQLLWDRYRAMFSLRNDGSKEAAIILGKALRRDKSSCLFRHEVAFVLGQLEHPASEPYLAEALRDESEHAMVRHEAAEAIGAIAEKHSLSLLEGYVQHPEAIVKDSCVVAIDMHKYWSQYKKVAPTDGDEQHDA